MFGISLKPHSAFSLVELSVTIAILGIVAGLGIAQFNNYKNRTYDLMAQSMLESLRDALIDYSINEISDKTLSINLTTSNISNFSNLPASIQTRLGSHGGVNMAVDLSIIAGKVNYLRFSTGHCKGSGGYTADGLYGPAVHAKYVCQSGGMCWLPAAFVGINLRPPCY